MLKVSNLVFFDAAQAYGLVNGVVHVELVANVLRSGGEKKLELEVVEAGQLRCSISAARSLIQALQSAIGEDNGETTNTEGSEFN